MEVSQCNLGLASWCSALKSPPYERLYFIFASKATNRNHWWGPVWKLWAKQNICWWCHVLSKLCNSPEIISVYFSCDAFKEVAWPKTLIKTFLHAHWRDFQIKEERSAHEKWNLCNIFCVREYTCYIAILEYFIILVKCSSGCINLYNLKYWSSQWYYIANILIF